MMLAFLIKHYLFDFVFQTDYIAQNKGKSLSVLLIHALYHGTATWILLTVATEKIELSLIIGLLEVVIHFGIDKLKLIITGDKFNRYTLGADQLLHCSWYYFICLYLGR